MSTGRRSPQARSVAISDEHIQVLVKRLNNRVQDLRAALDLLNGDVQDALGKIEGDLELLQQAHASRSGHTTAAETKRPPASQMPQAGPGTRQPNAPPAAWSEETTVPNRSSAQPPAGRSSKAAGPPSRTAQPPPRANRKSRTATTEPKKSRPAPAKEVVARPSRPAAGTRDSAIPAKKPAPEARETQPKKALNHELADLFERSAWDDDGDEMDQFEDGTGFDEPVGEFEDHAGAANEPEEKLDNLLSGYLGGKQK